MVADTKSYLYFFFDFHYTFRKIGGGSDPSVKNVTLFFLMKASLNYDVTILAAPKNVISP
jgi:hypothetical protein